MLCLDNDEPGRAASAAIQKRLSEYEIIDNPPRRGKDYNDQLQLVKGISGRVKTRGGEARCFSFSAGLGLQAACGCFAVASIAFDRSNALVKGRSPLISPYPKKVNCCENDINEWKST